MLRDLDKTAGKVEVVAHEADVSMTCLCHWRKVRVGGRVNARQAVNIGEPTERLCVVDYKTAKCRQAA